MLPIDPITRGATVDLLSTDGPYYKAFRQMEQTFYASVHPAIDLGLLFHDIFEDPDEAKSTANIFTFHGPNHIQKLVECIDKLVASLTTTLSESEAYILLCAAHCHDVGNVYGRIQHEGHAYDLLNAEKYTGCFVDDSGTKFFIGDTAQAHGGKHPLYKKDTIRELLNRGTIDLRLPLLAAILRLADELSEHPSRVPAFISDHASIKTESPLCHAYSRSLYTFELRGNKLCLHYFLHEADSETKGSVVDKEEITELSFLEYMERRIDKLESEVRYCCQYSRPHLDISDIAISFEPRQKNGRTSQPYNFSIPLNVGYPMICGPLCTRSPELSKAGINSLEEYVRTS